MPRFKRGIQYAAASQLITTVSGILGHPLSRVTTAVIAATLQSAHRHWNVMSWHLVTSEPRPEAMVMQPRSFCWVVSATHIE